MRARIAAHRARRGEGWRTVEAPLEMPDAVLLAPGRPLLVDCLTLWLTNLLLAGRDLAEAADALDDALDWRDSPSVLVASEVGLGIVPETPLGRRFRDEAGLLHQRLAARADRVVLMVAGLPMSVK
jgi:adenosyl cobinamide kinase/adenosyl cobinamide phosphate guanylyltransferase